MAKNLYKLFLQVVLLFFLITVGYFNFKNTFSARTRSAKQLKQENEKKVIVNFIRHSDFDHGRGEKLWENFNNFSFIIRRLAYYDNRSKSDVAVVLVAMYDERQGKNPPEISMLVSYPGNMTLCRPVKFWIKSGGLHPNTHEWYVNYMIRTTLPHNEQPLHVSLTTDKTCKTGLTDSIPVLGVELHPNALTYGVCLHKGLIKTKDPQVLIDWIELHIELGAELITIYFQDVPEYMYEFTRPYVESGIVEVLDWNFRVPTGFTKNYGQSAVINECIYRNMNRVKYIALIDIDEYIVPSYKYRRVQEIIPLLNKGVGHPCGFLFHNTYFFDDFNPVPRVKSWTKFFCSKLDLPRYFSRTKKATKPSKYGSHKMIVKPIAVNSAQVHHIISHQKNFQDLFEVDDSFGGSYHYRWPYRMKDFSPHVYCDDMGRYVDAVLPRIIKQMCKSNFI